MARLRDDIDEETPAAQADPDGHRKLASWHRGEVVNYFPNQSDYFDKAFLRNFLLKGWTPEAPFLTRGTKITAFGSCFAANITRHLDNLGYDLSSRRDPDIHISRIGDGLVNTASILGQFEWALENKKQPENLWHGFKAEGYGYDEDVRLRTRDVFLATEFFIITLGLSEVWYDEATGGTFWRAVPNEVFDGRRHKFRVMSMEETKADIARIHALIRKHVPEAKILFTISPIPLAATFRPVACLSANSVSKAILRASLDEFLRGKPEEMNRNLFYFPSLEIVQQGFIDPWSHDNRHPQNGVLDTVMKTFEAVYCVGEGSLDDASELLQMFRAQNVEDVANRKASDGDHQRMIVAARNAKKAGMKARLQAKAREIELNRVMGSEAGDGEDVDQVAAKRARRQRRRAEREELGLRKGKRDTE
jgi:hypothetical protein